MRIDFSLTEQKSYQKSIKEKVDNLQSLSSFTDKTHFEINLILDEICTNIFAHNSAKDSLKITITMEDKNDSIQITIIDNGKSFDPTAALSPDTNLSLEKREPGGLGLFLVKKYSTFISYINQESSNKTIIEKKIR